jgi:broad specificity phosphatase PhoE
MARDHDLLFIRHGETDWNRQQRFQGQIDVPLNDIGLAQAQRLGQRLATDPAELLVASDLMRTRQTAAPLAQAWQLDPLLLPGFREQNFGVLEGLDVPTIKQRHPDLWADWLLHRADFALPGGESLPGHPARRDLRAAGPQRRRQDHADQHRLRHRQRPAAAACWSTATTSCATTAPRVR